MLNYPVKLYSVKDLMELKKIAERYDVKGRINQNGFHGDIKSVIKNILYLPLEDATLEIEGYRESQIDFINEAVNKLSA